MEFDDLSIKSLDATNIVEEHICCAMSDKKSIRGVLNKKSWMKSHFNHGLHFKKVDVRGKVFIEYMPAEYAWRPIVAPGYMFIQCLWVSGKYKGQCLGKKRNAEHAGAGIAEFNIKFVQDTFLSKAVGG